MIDNLCLSFLQSGIEKAFAEKKIASLVGVESGHAISSSLGVLRMFYEAGARYMTLTHSCNTPWYAYAPKLEYFVVSYAVLQFHVKN